MPEAQRLYDYAQDAVIPAQLGGGRGRQPVDGMLKSGPGHCIAPGPDKHSVLTVATIKDKYTVQSLESALNEQRGDPSAEVCI
jgi:hypothetical protein